MKKGIKVFIAILLILDLGYTFYLNFHFPLDGDLASIMMPEAGQAYHDVLQDPFALDVLLEGRKYTNPNRYFSHAALNAWFRSVPFVFQTITNPVDSVYLAAALAKTAIQFFIIWLLAVIISNKSRLWEEGFLMAAVLITPLFQTFGLNRHMAIIDQSVTYVFFYALPLAMLLLFLLPVLREYLHGRKWEPGRLMLLLWLLLIPVICLSGPIFPGVVLLLVPLWVFAKAWMHFRSSRRWTSLESGSSARTLFLGSFFASIPIRYWVAAGLLLFFGFYSFYVGGFNVENDTSADLSLWERYSRLPLGLYLKFTTKIGFPLLLILILVQGLWIRYKADPESRKQLLQFVVWGLIFSVLYLFLLPFGGYRDYREHIIRYDTIMPVTTYVFMAWGLSSYYIFRRLDRTGRFRYMGLIAAVVLIFSLPDTRRENGWACEYAALQQIQDSKEEVVVFESDCPVFSWFKIEDPEDSKRAARILHYWGISQKGQLYYSK
ncbi:MAG: hypothetical protein GYB31_07720 [Bacteroidetes bacterium]|nr:hypothetical protein [Bacteroidota bacterium]